MLADCKTVLRLLIVSPQKGGVEDYSRTVLRQQENSCKTVVRQFYRLPIVSPWQRAVLELSYYCLRTVLLYSSTPLPCGKILRISYNYLITVSLLSYY